MTISQKQNLENEIEAFAQQDYNKIFAERNVDNPNIDSIMAGDYRVIDLIEQSAKVTSLLDKAITSDSWLSLPSTFSVPDYGQMTICQAIQNLRTHLTRGSYSNAVPLLNFLISYARCFGLWSPARNLELGIREASLAKLENRAETIQKHTDERAKRIEDLITEVGELKTQISEFFDRSRQEASILTSNTQSSKTLLAEIKGVQGNVNTINESVTNINNQCSDLLQKLNGLQENAANIQVDLQKKNEQIETTRKAVDNAVQNEAETVKQVYAETLEAENKVKELMSYISDGTLAHSFNQRKTDVRKASYIWLGLGVLASIALVVLILILFTSSKMDMTNLWADIVMKTLKTFPIACMVVYFFKEYSKERALTEEYAFREAVAITLKAYLDQLEGEKDENKRTLLLQTVEKLYTKPAFSTKEEPSIKFKTKDFVDLADKLVEGIKAVKS